MGRSQLCLWDSSQVSKGRWWNWSFEQCDWNFPSLGDTPSYHPSALLKCLTVSGALWAVVSQRSLDKVSVQKQSSEECGTVRKKEEKGEAKRGRKKER